MTITKSQINDKIAAFLYDYGVHEVSGSSPLFSSGRLNSLDVLSLITFIENNYALKINPFDVSLEGFDCIDLIVDFVSRRIE